MAKYSDIKGFTVQTLSTDTIASQILGGSWASGGDMNTARSRGAAGGTQTANISFMGAASTAYVNAEVYDGSSWTEVGDSNTPRYDVGGSGTSTSALGFGGTSTSANTESWNGSAWTEIADLNTGRRVLAGSGASNTSALAFGGFPSYYAITESYDGSSWTEVADLNQARRKLKGIGTATAALAVGGSNPGVLANVEQWDGSSWTEVSDINSARELMSMSGTSTAALEYGGENPIVATTESWDGSSWTEVADLATARSAGTGCMQGSTSFAALQSGGQTPSYVATTEEFTAPAVFNQIQEGQLFFNSTANAFKETIKDIPGTTWSSGGNLNTGRKWGGQGVLGVQTATLLCGGGEPGNSAKTERYDGTSWTEVNDLNAVNGASMCWGTTTSAINCGGAPPRKQVESWDGTSWTETTDFNNPRYGGLGAGSSNTSGIIFGGENPSPGGPHPGPYFSATEVWDGSSWTEVNEMNQARYGMLGGGAIYTAAISAGGADPVPSYAALTEIWDGTSWTEVSDMNEKRMTGVGFGITTSLIATGGDPQGDSPRTSTELWDGTSWTQLSATISTENRSQISSGGANASTGVIFGGRTPPANVQNSTEEWTANLSNKTITSS